MRVRPPHYWFLAGFLAASVMAALAPLPARAQTGPDPQAKTVPGLTLPDQTGRPGQATRSNPTTDPTAGDQGEGATDDVTPADDPSQDPLDINDDDNSTLPADQRAAPVDGDLTGPAEQNQPRDGVVDTPQDRPVVDGVDPTSVDLRSREDRELFENATRDTIPAGYDPLLFQIEDIDPIATDRRPERLFRAEPYDPIGIKLGSFVYFPEAEISGVATNNVLRANKPASDVYLGLESNSRLVSNWKVHALEFRSRNVLSFHDEFSTEDDRAWALEARGRLDIDKRTNLQGLVSHDVRQEGRGAIDAATSGPRPNVTTDEGRLALNHRFNRLTLQVRGGVTDLAYDDITTGSLTSINSDRNSTTTQEAVRAAWEFKPTFAIFAEVELNQRAFDKPAQGDLILRSSNGTRTRAGVDFGSTSTIVRGEISLGVGTQTPDDARLESSSAFLVDSNLVWRMSDLTSFRFAAQTDIFDTNTVGSAAVVSHQYGLEARHEFRKYLIGTAGVTYTTRDYQGVRLAEDEARYALGSEYFLNREVMLFGRYEHIDFNSNQALSSYAADDFRLGVKIRR